MPTASTVKQTTWPLGWPATVHHCKPLDSSTWKLLADQCAGGKRTYQCKGCSATMVR